MAKFIYKMQSLLNIKEKLEEQEKTAYGLAKATLNEEEQRLAELVAKKNRYIEEKRVEMSSSIHVQELTLLEHAIKSMEYRVEEQVLVVKRAERRRFHSCRRDLFPCLLRGISASDPRPLWSAREWSLYRFPKGSRPACEAHLEGYWCKPIQNFVFYLPAF